VGVFGAEKKRTVRVVLRGLGVLRRGVSGVGPWGGGGGCRRESFRCTFGVVPYFYSFYYSYLIFSRILKGDFISLRPLDLLN
jgi:hypothetical protein